MGSNGGLGRVILVDGMLTGLWRDRDGALETELFRPLSRRERGELDDELERTRALLGDRE